MLEPLSVGALYLGYAALASYARSTSAVSPEASRVCEAAALVMRSRESSEALFGQKAAALSELQSAVDAVLADESQDAVEPQAYRNAWQLLLALPDDLPAPEFGVDPDGAISMDWIRSRTRMFSVSVTASDRLAYAWLDGSDKGHGVARFRGSDVPGRLLSEIRAIVDASSGLRAA